jgi:hypothetical protein
VFVSSKRLNAGMLLGFGGQGVEIVWSTRKLITYMSACVLVDDALFGFDDNTLRCLGTDGKERWGERGMGEGAVLGAGERLIVINANGELIIAEANPTEYAELSRTKLFGDEDGYLFTPAVLANGLIYCRSSNGRLVCRDHRKSE